MSKHNLDAAVFACPEQLEKLGPLGKACLEFVCINFPWVMNSKDGRALHQICATWYAAIGAGIGMATKDKAHYDALWEELETFSELQMERAKIAAPYEDILRDSYSDNNPLRN